MRRTCCNYDNGNCILLDDGDECVCPQLISYSLLCKWFRVAVLPADRPVSYTHLDVYKRQRYHYENSMNDIDGFIGAHDDRLPPEVIELSLIHISKKAIAFVGRHPAGVCIAVAALLLFIMVSAVSYTHLDVYKRQTIR